jgi:hypothetical protein
MMRPLRSLDAPTGDELAAWELLRSVDTEVALSELSAARILSRVNAESRRPARGYPRWLVAAAAVALSLLGLQVAMAAMLAGVPALRHRLGAAVERTGLRIPGASFQDRRLLRPLRRRPSPRLSQLLRRLRAQPAPLAALPETASQGLRSVPP